MGGSGAVLGGLGRFGGSKVLSPGGKGERPRAGLTECAIAVEDEVFEEEESAVVLGDSARPCHPDGGGGFNRLRAFRRAGVDLNRGVVVSGLIFFVGLAGCGLGFFEKKLQRLDA